MLASRRNPRISEHIGGEEEEEGGRQPTDRQDEMMVAGAKGGRDGMGWDGGQRLCILHRSFKLDFRTEMAGLPSRRRRQRTANSRRRLPVVLMRSRTRGGGGGWSVNGSCVCGLCTSCTVCC